MSNFSYSNNFSVGSVSDNNNLYTGMIFGSSSGGGGSGSSSSGSSSSGTSSVSVKLILTVSPGSQTVRTRGSNVPEDSANTAFYSVMASYSPVSPGFVEVKPGDIVSWEALSVEFGPNSKPGANPATPSYDIVTPVPPNSASRTFKVHSDEIGRWSITVSATIKFQKMTWNPNTQNYVVVPGEFLSLEGSTTTMFETTMSPVLFSLEDSVIVRQATGAHPKRKIYEGSVRFAETNTSGQIVLGSRSVPSGGGAVMFATSKNAIELGSGNGSGSITLTIAAGQATKFYVYGATESKNMDDVRIEARSLGNPMASPLGEISATVLWVAIDINTGNVHQKNTCRDLFIQQSPEKTDKLGKKMWTHNRPQGLVDYYSYCYEVQGTVKPGNFTGDLELLRDADVKAHIDSPLLLQNPPFQNPRAIPAPNQKNFGGNPGESANDTSDSDWLDLTSRPLIFDIDCPTPGVDPNVYVNNITNMFREQGFPVNGISFKVVCTFKFREFATFGGTRCSDVKEFQTQFTFERNNNGAVMVDGQNWP